MRGSKLKYEGEKQMNIEQETNKVFLQGIIDTDLEFNHMVKEDEFYSFNLKVIRLSGQYDIIPVIVSKRLMEENNLTKDKKIAIRGQFRSFNKLENEKRRLILSVFVKELCEYDENLNPNIIELDGYICKPVVYRTTPFSREICDILLAVNRNFNKSDYIPCIAWGSNAQQVSNYDVPTKLKIIGRIQSREYIKHFEGVIEPVTKIAYEVSIAKLLEVE